MARQPQHVHRVARVGKDPPERRRRARVARQSMDDDDTGAAVVTVLHLTPGLTAGLDGGATVHEHLPRSGYGSAPYSGRVGEPVPRLEHLRLS